jgi:hypothetical protein
MDQQQTSAHQRRAETAVLDLLQSLASRSTSGRVVASGARKALLAARRAEWLSTTLLRIPPVGSPRSPQHAAKQDKLCMALSNELDDPAFLLLASSSDEDDAAEHSPAEDCPPSPPACTAAPFERTEPAHGAAAAATQDIWQLVFSSLSCAELCRTCAPVCRTWREAAKGAAQWEAFDVDRAGTAGRVILFDESGVLPALAHWLCGRARNLRLSTSDIGDRGLAALLAPTAGRRRPQTQTQVRRLDLSFCTRLTDAALASLSALPQLASLNLDGVHRLSNPGLYSLANGVGRSLRELSLDGESLTDHWLQQVLSALPLLEALEISFCEALTDASLGSLMRHKRRRPFRKLALRKGFAFSDEAMMELLSAPSCQPEQRARESGLDNEPATATAVGLEVLEELDLAECHALGDLTGNAIGKHCRQLQNLVLSWCWGISDQSALAVVGGCPELVSLRLVGLKGLTTASLAALPVCCPKLVELDVRQCDYIEDDALCLISAGMDEKNAGSGRPRLVVRNYYGEVLRLAQPGLSPPRRVE